MGGTRSERVLKRQRASVNEDQAKALFEFITKSEDMKPFYAAQCLATHAYEEAGEYANWTALKVFWLPLVIIANRMMAGESATKQTQYYVADALERTTRRFRREQKENDQ